MDEFLAHYGTKFHSGRYPYGSGDNPYQHDGRAFLAAYRQMHAEGMSDKEIAESMGISTKTLRERRSIFDNQERAANVARAVKLRKKYSTNKVAELMGVPEATVRNWLKDPEKYQKDTTTNIANALKDNLSKNRYLDVGEGINLEMNCSEEKFNTALEMLKTEGYTVTNIYVEQATNKGKKTTVKVLAPPGTSTHDIYENMSDIGTVTSYTPNNGKDIIAVRRPSSLDSKRVYIRYAEDGGLSKDGTIELRRGVDDISLGNSNYAQVRIMVDDSRYLKGMALYSDNIPDGYDVVFNTNKSKDIPKEEVMKKIKDDPDNPFGALIKAGGQRDYRDPETGELKLSPVNKIKEEGDWNEYSKSLSSQFLSKQSKKLIKTQLDQTYSDRETEFNDIMALENDVVKEKLLKDFAENCDAAAVHLKAAALPRQSSKVILPVDGLKENEIYAPTYNNGEKVCLIRYPHGGIFEIPELVVNNKNKDGKAVVGPNAIDAVGINQAVAARLSGADFDGDTVMVIPVNDKVKINTKKPLKGLEGFDPQAEYKGYEGMKIMNNTQMEMGKISNLITDMTLQGATDDELARAVRHSMVVIDAEKHKLNYKLSEEQNGIDALKRKYQAHEDGRYGGASTLISLASSTVTPDERKRSYKPNPETGEWEYTYSGRTYDKYKKDKKTGEYILLKKDIIAPSKQSSTRMAETKDAYSLSSGTWQEDLYADYANKMKALANKTRKIAYSIKPVPASKDAKAQYAPEIDSLKRKLDDALKNAPRERMAQIQAASIIKDKIEKYGDQLDKEHLAKESQRALTATRAKYGAGKKDLRISFTPKEWEAVQNNAISSTMLKSLLDNADMDEVRKLATPKDYNTVLSPGKEARLKAMIDRGFTYAEVAKSLGVSTTTVANYAN